MSQTVLGIDASLTATGLAVWRNGRISLQTIRTAPEHGDKPTRWRRILGRVMPHVSGPNTLAVVEAVHVHMGSAVLELAPLHGVLLYGLHARGARYVVPQPKQVKKFATGSGGADKDAMVAAAHDQLGVLVANHNEADALWLAAMGLHKYGRPLVDVPVVRACALDATDWPLWSLDEGELTRGTQ